MNRDEFFMRQAIALALKAKGRTFPNPLVGALVVKHNRIIGSGYHRRAGGPHAEIFALRQAGTQARGAALYVTLEPCFHFGRTPPCVDAIVHSGVREVVIGMRDPNSPTNGKSIRLLRKNKIRVKVGFFAAELSALNAPFIKRVTKHMPFVTVKVGQSLDGKIATRLGESQWITGEPARRHARSLRSLYDAIMVGAGAALKDNPVLNQLPAQRTPRFFKIIVDTELRMPARSRILSKESVGTVIIAVSRTISRRKIRPFVQKGARVIFCKSQQGKIDMKDLLRQLARLEITNILVEGGGSLIGSLFDARVVDRIAFFVAPKIIGGSRATTSVAGTGVGRVNKAIRLFDVRAQKIGEDFFIEAGVC